ncbi:hypothetical protein Efla_006273 [Eimeria flavescens]
MGDCRAAFELKLPWGPHRGTLMLPSRQRSRKKELRLFCFSPLKAAIIVINSGLFDEACVLRLFDLLPADISEVTPNLEVGGWLLETPMDIASFDWPAAWLLAQPLPADERNKLIAHVEAGATFLLHLRDDALKRQLEEDEALQHWLKNLLLLLPPSHELLSPDFSPLPHRTQELLLRTYLRIAKLQQNGLQHQQLLPCTACLDVCLAWESANPALCSEAAAALLASLKPTRRHRLLEELRDTLPAALDDAARTLEALSRRQDSPALLPTAGTATAAGSGAQAAAWLQAAITALQPLVEDLATLRVATCCLPTSFALELWSRDRQAPPSVDAVITSFMTAAPQKTPQAPFTAPLMRVYAALARAPWVVPGNLEASFLPRSLHQAVARARGLACSCLVGDAAVQSQAVREELKAGANRRPSRWLSQQAEELLQEWGATLLQLFEASSADGGATDKKGSDLKAAGACTLLRQWRGLEVNADLLDYIDSIIFPQAAEAEDTNPKRPPPTSPASETVGSACWALTPEDAKTVAQLQDMLPEHGAGYLYLALRELRGNADEVVSILLEDRSLAALRSVPLRATLEGYTDAAAFLAADAKGTVPPQEPPGPDMERRILALAERVAEEALECSSDSDDSLYDDDADEELLAEAAAAPRSATESEAEESSSSEKETPRGTSSFRGGTLPFALPLRLHCLHLSLTGAASGIAGQDWGSLMYPSEKRAVFRGAGTRSIQLIDEL